VYLAMLLNQIMLCCLLPQGPTSSGKTSLVAYLAAQTGHSFVRINNHQHTDLQEYLGSWVPDEQGEPWAHVFILPLHVLLSAVQPQHILFAVQAGSLLQG
jgi:MoxR-like ATPase